MSLNIRADSIDRDIELLLEESLSPKARSRQLAEFAEEQINEAKQTNKTILGRVLRYTVSVDGRKDAPLSSVKPDGYVIAEFELFNDVLTWIADQLIKHSPVKSGQYQRSHTLFADGQEVDANAAMPAASELVFMSTAPYARKIELGSSSQAPDGVYQAVAILAAMRFGNVAKISFGYRTALSGSLVGGRVGNRSDNRNPAIIVKVR